MQKDTATGAPTPITLSGHEYLLSPLTAGDLGIVLRWAKSNLLDLARDNLKGLTRAQQDGLLQHAYDMAAALTIDSPEVTDVLSGVEHIKKILWLSLRKHHPTLTEEDAANLLDDTNNLTLISSRMSDLSTYDNKIEESIKKEAT